MSTKFYNVTYSNPRPTKQELLNSYSTWFDELSKEESWHLFAITVTFKSGGSMTNEMKWSSEYKRVLSKIEKNLERHPDKHNNVIPMKDHFYYEKDEASIFRVTGSRKPHHIHAIVPIQSNHLSRFWSTEDNDLKDRLKKDINSLKTVQSILVEPIKAGESKPWLSYMTKFKDI